MISITIGEGREGKRSGGKAKDLHASVHNKEEGKVRAPNTEYMEFPYCKVISLGCCFLRY